MFTREVQKSLFFFSKNFKPFFSSLTLFLEGSESNSRAEWDDSSREDYKRGTDDSDNERGSSTAGSSTSHTTISSLVHSPSKRPTGDHPHPTNIQANSHPQNSSPQQARRQPMKKRKSILGTKKIPGIKNDNGNGVSIDKKAKHKKFEEKQQVKRAVKKEEEEVEEDEDDSEYDVEEEEEEGEEEDFEIKLDDIVDLVDLSITISAEIANLFLMLRKYVIFPQKLIIFSYLNVAELKWIEGDKKTAIAFWKEFKELYETFPSF